MAKGVGMLNRDQIDEFDRNGFLNGGVVLTDGERLPFTSLAVLRNR